MRGTLVARRLLIPGAFALVGVLFLSATRASNPPSGTGRSSFPARVVSGDEPHYLLATNALLQGDGFCLQKAYRRVLLGDLDAGLRAAGHPLDHHTVLLERGQAVVSDAAVDQPAPGKAGDLDADVR